MDTIHEPNQHLTRQMGLISMDVLTTPIHIIGAGAIGSFTAFNLAKMGMKDITVWDYDTVSIYNMNCQLYRFKDIGKSKVQALAEIVEEFTGVKLKIRDEKYEPGKLRAIHRGIYVVAVDSIDVRRTVFLEWSKIPSQVHTLIDPRMGAEDYTQFTVKKRDDLTAYARTFEDNDDMIQTPCTEKSTVYTAGLAAGMITKTIKNLLLGQPYPQFTNWSIKDSEVSPSKHAMLMYPGGVQ